MPNNVDLPQPEGPKIASDLPWFKENEMSSNIIKSLNPSFTTFVIFFDLIAIEITFFRKRGW